MLLWQQGISVPGCQSYSVGVMCVSLFAKVMQIQCFDLEMWYLLLYLLEGLDGVTPKHLAADLAEVLFEPEQARQSASNYYPQSLFGPKLDLRRSQGGRVVE